MEGVNELKYRANVPDKEKKAYLATLPQDLKAVGVSYVDDLTEKLFTNSQVGASESWIREPIATESDGLYVQPDPRDPDGKFGDPSAYGFNLNESINENDVGLGLTRKELNVKIYANGETSNSQGLYGIYGVFGNETDNYYTFPGGIPITFVMKFNDVSTMKLRVAIMPEKHPLRWKPSTDGRDEIYDIIINAGSFKITPKSFKKVGDRWFSPIATLQKIVDNPNAYGSKYLKNVDYERLYNKYKAKYLNLKKQLNKH